MRTGWGWSSCVVLLAFAVLGREAAAAHVGGLHGHRDIAHKVAKSPQITPFPEFPQKRDGSGLCDAGLNLCAASLNGGCCPDRYACATDSCYLTTAASASQCNTAGYTACGYSVGGGCCPDGYVCGQNDCTPPAGVTNTMTHCPANYYLCPSSFNFGCCESGMGCGLAACYTTTPVTYTVTETVTTTTGGQTLKSTVTATTVQTPSPPTALVTDGPTANVAKFIPTTVPKVAQRSDNSGGGGLTSGEIGGIVGGAVALLIVVVVAAFFIIRRLNRVVEAVEISKKGSSSATRSNNQPGMAQIQANAALAGHFKPTTSEIDSMSIDPLIVLSGGNTPSSQRRPRSDSNYSASQQGTPYGHPSSASELGSGIRGPSMDSSVPGSYFDIPQRVQNVPGRHANSVAGSVVGGHTNPSAASGLRQSIDSQATGPSSSVQHQSYQSQQGYQYQHVRHESNASEMSDGSAGGASHGVGSPLIPAELSIEGGFIPELATGPMSPTTPRPSLQHNRRRSEQQGVASNLPLDVVNEGTELIHGYYGPRHRQVGQTAAGLEVGHDLSSPTQAASPSFRDPQNGGQS